MSFRRPEIRCGVSVPPLTRRLFPASLYFATAACFADGTPRFEADIQPVLIANCYECHGPGMQRGEADLRSVELMTQPRGSLAPVVIPGNPDDSLLFQSIELGFMPPDGQLGNQQIELIRSWIVAGCPADSPRAVFGATFFQNWGTLLCILAVANALVAAILWRDGIPRGPLVIVLAGLPMVAVMVSAEFWIPPDVYSVGAAVLMGMGCAIGGSLIAADNGSSIPAGAALGLLAPVGLCVLARGPRQPVSASRGDAPPASDEQL